MEFNLKKGAFLYYFKNWLPAILYCFVIFVASSIQNAELSSAASADFFIRKFLHFFIYFGLYFTFFKATKDYKISFVLSVLYAISDEIHQYFVPTRGAKITDIIIDSAGALLAWYLLWKFFQNLPKTLKNWLLN